MTTPDSSNFKYVEGRRYHSEEDSAYFLPNDEEECDRLYLQHFLIRYICQSNFSAPVENILSKKGSKVLDSG